VPHGSSLLFPLCVLGGFAFPNYPSGANTTINEFRFAFRKYPVLLLSLEGRAWEPDGDVERVVSKFAIFPSKFIVH
jgi:hypothetical protein